MIKFDLSSLTVVVKIVFYTNSNLSTAVLPRTSLTSTISTAVLLCCAEHDHKVLLLIS